MHKKTSFLGDRIDLQRSIFWNKNCIVLQMKNINLSWKKILLNSAPKYKKENGKNSSLGEHKNVINDSKVSPTLLPLYTG